ncbi:MAG: hypothetical protein C0401_07785 [Anaerolinea sp.]|nr:hypothetical protein [Anaerolinea sp.]
MQREAQQIPGSGAAETSLEDLYRCPETGSKSFSCFFFTSMMILFNMSGLGCVLTIIRCSMIAYKTGLVFVAAVSLINGKGIPLTFQTLNLPIVALLWLLSKRKDLTKSPN